MQISCDCGNFKATLSEFPKRSTGRLVCYCSDCQAYLNRMGRQDLLDEYGGTEIVAVYPDEVTLDQGDHQLKCCQLTDQGPYRWFASCCNTPIVNTRAGFPWAGFFHNTFKKQDAECLNKLGDIRARIFGKDALAGAPFRISSKVSLNDMAVVLPFILRGKILGKTRNSPFFKIDNRTPTREVVKPPVR